MKAKVCLVVMLMSCACLSALFGAEEPENFFEDPGFEIAMKNALGLWQIRAPGSAKVTLDRKEMVAGEQSLYVEVPMPGGPTVGVYQDPPGLTLEADTKYTLSGWMKSTEPGYVSLRIMATGLGGENPVTEWGMKRVIAGEEWKEHYLTCEPKDFTETPRAEYRFGIIDDLWIDQTRLYEGEFVPSKGPEGFKSVRFQDKLAITWGGIRKR